MKKHLGGILNFKLSTANDYTYFSPRLKIADSLQFSNMIDMIFTMEKGNLATFCTQKKL
jgi:hypothetical protein